MTLSSENLRQDDLDGTFGADKDDVLHKPLKYIGVLMGKGSQAV